MASLVPDDFDLSVLPHGEQRVVAAFLDGLGDEWVVLPSLWVSAPGGDREIDVVIASPDTGVICVEVKGGLVACRGTTWTSYDRKIKNPAAQSRAAKYALLNYLGTTGVSRPFLAHAIALPDVVAPREGMGPDAPRTLIFDRNDLDQPATAVARILPDPRPIGADRFQAFVQALRPDITLEVSEGAYMDRARAAIDATTASQLSAVRSMDANRRVLVEGGAGTGKTWLVATWARRAAARGERTAVVCFNRPIADVLARKLAGTDVVVNTYHGLGMQMLTTHGAKVPAEPDAAWWRKGMAKALRKRAEKIGTPFDTIVVDEAQDLRPRWLESLRALLDPGGADHLLMTLDPSQAIYLDKWGAPDEFAHITLDVNLRNSRAIGELCAHLGGPEPLGGGPVGSAPRFERATGAKELRKRVERRLDDLIGEGVVPSQIAVLTTHTDERDALIATVAGPAPLARWEERTPATVLCETVHRTKGLEWQAVVLATLDDPIDPQLLYVGASRPRLHLTLVGPDSLAAAVGLREGGH